MTTACARRGTAWWAGGPVLALVVFLAGCAEVGQSVQNAVNDVSTAFQPKPAEPAPQAPPTYCYRTIGKVNCYSQPLPASEANRLIGYQGPPPRSSSGSGPLSP